MIQKIRHIIHIIISFFTDSFSLLKAFFYQIQRQHFRREIKNEIQNNKLLILANGPSLSNVLDRIRDVKGADYCVVNLSALTDIFWQLKPKIYVMTDMSIYVHRDEEIFLKFREEMLKVDWFMEYCVPFHYPDWFLKDFKKNPHLKISRYTTEPWSPELHVFKNLRLWFYKKGLIAPNCSNVLIAAIYASLLKGYKEIFLFGADHSWIKDIRINEKNQVLHVDRHYYGTTEHVWLDYNKKPIHLTDLLESNLSTFRNHMNLREFADYLGDVKIINCTEGSYIDAYERGKLEDIINDDRTD